MTTPALTPALRAVHTSLRPAASGRRRPRSARRSPERALESTIPAVDGMRRDDGDSTDGEGADAYLAAVYDELRRRARKAMASLPPGQTLQPTAIVHEAYANLASRRGGDWKDEQHFLACATTAIRNAIVDRVRRRNAREHGVGPLHVSLDDVIPVAMPTAPDDVILRVDELLRQLRAIDARAAAVVEQRFFMGRTEEDTARLLDVSDRTVRRDWTFAKAWLVQRLGGDVGVE